uniref:Beta-defensin-like domain-containing protein n=1 Tax=Gopherus agassizii TaxID=38772 RepID=A0A452GGJ9_9SAUR
MHIIRLSSRNEEKLRCLYYSFVPLFLSVGNLPMQYHYSLACKGKHGRCREAFCFLNERQIGMCTFHTRFCCRRQK